VLSADGAGDYVSDFLRERRDIAWNDTLVIGMLKGKTWTIMNMVRVC